MRVCAWCAYCERTWHVQEPFEGSNGQRQLRGKRNWRWLRLESEAPPFVVVPSSSSVQHRNDSELFRFALVTDSHLWPSTAGRRAFSAIADARDIRDGLLVSHSPEVYAALLEDLRHFAARGGMFGVHAGDAVCGGNNFHANPEEFEAALRSVAATERAALGVWQMHHIAGNHDLHPTAGGLASWRRALGNATGAPRSDVAYRSIRTHGWRLILLDSASAVHEGFDTDGHGRLGNEQLEWLHGELVDSAASREQVGVGRTRDAQSRCARACALARARSPSSR